MKDHYNVQMWDLKDHCIVLDLDHTIIHSQTIQTQHDKEIIFPSDSRKLTVLEETIVVNFRPGLIAFLSRLNLKASLFVYTKGVGDYAKVIIQTINELAQQEIIPMSHVVHRSDERQLITKYMKNQIKQVEKVGLKNMCKSLDLMNRILFDRGSWRRRDRSSMCRKSKWNVLKSHDLILNNHNTVIFEDRFSVWDSEHWNRCLLLPPYFYCNSKFDRILNHWQHTQIVQAINSSKHIHDTINIFSNIRFVIPASTFTKDKLHPFFHTAEDFFTIVQNRGGRILFDHGSSAGQLNNHMILKKNEIRLWFDINDQYAKMKGSVHWSLVLYSLYKNEKWESIDKDQLIVDIFFKILELNETQTTSFLFRENDCDVEWKKFYRSCYQAQTLNLDIQKSQFFSLSSCIIA